MGLNGLLPESLLTKMSTEDRKAIGQKTMPEVREKYEAGEEKKLQSDIRQYLRLHNIWFDADSMAKRRSGTKGAPDFLFCYRGKAIAAEAKTATGKLSGDQIAAHEQMRKNGWCVIIAHSVADLQTLFREIDMVAE